METREIARNNGSIIRHKICEATGKICYSKNRAMQVKKGGAKTINRRLREYECVRCGYFHITSMIGDTDHMMEIPKGEIDYERKNRGRRMRQQEKRRRKEERGNKKRQ